MPRRSAEDAPLSRKWTNLPEKYRFRVRAAPFWVRHGAYRGEAGTVIAARKTVSGVMLRVRFRDGMIAEDHAGTVWRTA
jgi:hypothetical protein